MEPSFGNRFGARCSPGPLVRPRSFKTTAFAYFPLCFLIACTTSRSCLIFASFLLFNEFPSGEYRHKNPHPIGDDHADTAKPFSHHMARIVCSQQTLYLSRALLSSAALSQRSERTLHGLLTFRDQNPVFYHIALRIFSSYCLCSRPPLRIEEEESELFIAYHSAYHS